MLGGSENKTDEEQLILRAKQLGIIKGGGENLRFCVMVVKFKDIYNNTCTTKKHTDFLTNILSKYFTCETLIVFSRAVVLAVLNEDGKLSNVLELSLKETVQSAKRLLDQSCTIGVSREFYKLSDCSDAYFQAVTARRYTSDGTGEIRFIADQEHNFEFEFDKAEKTAAGIEQLLKVGTQESLNDFLNSLYETNTPENANLLVLQIIATVFRVVSSVVDKNELTELIGKNPIFSRLTSYGSEQTMKNELLEFCGEAKAIIENSRKRDSEVLCDKVLEIINDRYSDESLSLTSVSDELSVSPNYLSALIKKTKKKNFITLLTEKRMQTAYDLIVCSSMKMLEISEKCGYSDQHYFSYCFKKFYGESPNKLRQAKAEEK